MNVKKIKCAVENFTRIVHLADIHIRLTKRHDEYNQVFSNLYENIKDTPEDTCITILGDLFHSKSDLSPECVKMATDFLKKLADMRPTVLIPGNHDATLANKNRLDSLSPIVDALNHSNLFYFKETGLYILGDILFNHMSVFDQPEDYILAKNIPSIYRNKTNHIVGMFHGPVNESLTDFGHVVNNRSITTKLFNGHDIMLLGDIHRYQVLKTEDNVNCVYPGSLIQQNHGETLSEHGYVLWDLKQKQFKHFNIKNDFGFFTLDIKKGKLETDLKDLPINARIRCRCLESVPSEVKSIISDIRNKCNVIELTYVRIDADVNDSKKSTSSKDLNLSNISSADYQNSLIKDYLNNNIVDDKISDKTFELIFDINKKHNQEIDKDKLSKNIRWKPKKFEFSNMFSYGENNIVDFSNMKDVVGIFATNASGKSSILSALSFCIFDKCDRAFKASHILNAQKMSFSCKFNFEIDKIDYFIERIGKSDKKGNVKVDVNFWKVVDNKKIELNGEARRSTNDLIRDHLGSYEDFILTVLSIQNNKSGTFVDMGQKERKDLLSQFMGIDIFDNLYQSSYDKLKQIESELKIFTSRDDGKTIDQLKIDIVSLIENRDKLKLKEDSLYVSKNDINNKLISESKKIIQLDKKLKFDISQLKVKENDLTSDINDIQKEIESFENSKLQLQNKLSELELEISEFSQDEIKSDYNKFLEMKSKFETLKSEIDRKKYVVSLKLEKLKKLESHEYDPNCKYCTNNEFVKDAISSKESLKIDKTESESLIKSFKEINKLIEDNKHLELNYIKYNSVNQKISNLIKELNHKNDMLLKSNDKLNKMSNYLLETQSDIKYYFQQKNAIEHNEIVESNIDNLNYTLTKVEEDIRKINSELSDLNIKIKLYENDLASKEQNMSYIKSLESNLIAYKYYVLSVSRDGIPYELISKTIPHIEKEVNSILSQIAEFSVSIETDGKNVITNIVYEDKKWPLEMSSGFEKFASSLAIRVALINVSNLPRPDFIAIDEGFGCADADNLSSMSSLFSILKDHFKFILIISHLDSMKDMVDNILEIKKVNGFSKINN